ncbi:MAG: hypothetical protein V3T17_11370 [Pseudomonadales bacterium]
MRYAKFSPRGANIGTYYVRSPGYDFCGGGILTAGSSGRTDVKVDVMFVTGIVNISNIAGDAVPITDNPTRYTAFSAAPNTVTQTFYDFNGDGVADTVVKGKLLNQHLVSGSCQGILDGSGNPVQTFVPEAAFCNASDEADLQGVYFNAGEDSQCL